MTQQNTEGQVEYALFRTPWGEGAVAAASGAVRRLILPSEGEDIPRRLAREFGGARHNAGDPLLASVVRDLELYFTGQSVTFQSPLSTNGMTPFQTRVTDAALSIPFGSVRTYGWLAAQAGSPAASRACGQVMAANRIPVIVPCHRVVASGGKLGGYSGGLFWKERLLALEGISPDAVHLR